MSRFFNVQLQHWQHWPKVLVVECHEYTPDNDGGVTTKRYVPEVTCRDVSRNVEKFRCSLCGTDFTTIDSYGEPTIMSDGIAVMPLHCPICGGRIER